LTSFSVGCITLELLVSDVALAGDMAAVWQETRINQRWSHGRGSNCEGWMYWICERRSEMSMFCV